MTQFRKKTYRRRLCCVATKTAPERNRLAQARSENESFTISRQRKKEKTTCIRPKTSQNAGELQKRQHPRHSASFRLFSVSYWCCLILVDRQHAVRLPRTGDQRRYDTRSSARDCFVHPAAGWRDRPGDRAVTRTRIICLKS